MTSEIGTETGSASTEGSLSPGTAVETYEPQVITRDYLVSQLDVLKAGICQGATSAELHVFINLASAWGLNPFTNEIFWSDRLHRPIVARDGLLTIAERDANFNGVVSHAVYENDEIDVEWDAESEEMRLIRFKPNLLDRGKIIGAWAVAKYTGRGSFFVFVDHKQYQQGGPTWGKYVDAMTTKVAESILLRKLGRAHGLYIEGEFGEEYDPQIPEPPPPLAAPAPQIDSEEPVDVKAEVLVEDATAPEPTPGTTPAETPVEPTDDPHSWRKPARGESALLPAQLSYVKNVKGMNETDAAKTLVRWRQLLQNQRLRPRLAQWLCDWLTDHTDDWPTLSVRMGRINAATGQEVHAFRWLLPRFDGFCDEYIETLDGTGEAIALPMTVMAYVLAGPNDAEQVEAWYGSVEPFLISFANWLEEGHDSDEPDAEAAETEPEEAEDAKPEEVNPDPVPEPQNAADAAIARLEAEGKLDESTKADDDVPFEPPTDDDDDDEDFDLASLLDNG